MLRRASRFDLAIDKGDNSNTLVLTTVMRPDVTAKRYSRGSREIHRVLLVESLRTHKQKKICELTKSSKVDAKVDVKLVYDID